jgi:hypothetical protein
MASSRHRESGCLSAVTSTDQTSDCLNQLTQSPCHPGEKETPMCNYSLVRADRQRPVRSTKPIAFQAAASASSPQVIHTLPCAWPAIPGLGWKELLTRCKRPVGFTQVRTLLSHDDFLAGNSAMSRGYTTSSLADLPPLPMPQQASSTICVPGTSPIIKTYRRLFRQCDHKGQDLLLQQSRGQGQLHEDPNANLAKAESFYKSKNEG